MINALTGLYSKGLVALCHPKEKKSARLFGYTYIS